MKNNEQLLDKYKTFYPLKINNILYYGIDKFESFSLVWTKSEHEVTRRRLPTCVAAGLCPRSKNNEGCAAVMSYCQNLSTFVKPMPEILPMNLLDRPKISLECSYRCSNITINAMIKIYHNPRCKKSREGLELLEKSGEKFEVIKYLEEVPSKAELREVLNCLDITAENLVRKNEAVWKEKFRGRLLSDEEILDAMIQYPKLIERPIVVNGDRAVVGRPPERIREIL